MTTKPQAAVSEAHSKSRTPRERFGVLLLIAWGTNGTRRKATADFHSGLVVSLPKLHELVEQSGVELPSALVKLRTRTGDAIGTSEAKDVAKPK